MKKVISLSKHHKTREADQIKRLKILESCSVAMLKALCAVSRANSDK